MKPLTRGQKAAQTRRTKQQEQQRLERESAVADLSRRLEAGATAVCQTMAAGYQLSDGGLNVPAPIVSLLLKRQGAIRDGVGIRHSTPAEYAARAAASDAAARENRQRWLAYWHRRIVASLSDGTEAYAVITELVSWASGLGFAENFNQEEGA